MRGLPPDSLWGGQAIDRDQRDWLDGLPPTATVTTHYLGTVLFSHATPRDDSDVVVETTSDKDLSEKLEGVEADMVVCGSTHMQFDRRVGSYRVVNAGSVGMLYDQAGAFWILLHRDVEFRRTDYNRTPAAEMIRRRSDWEMADDFAQENVLKVPSKEEALTFLESLQ